MSAPVNGSSRGEWSGRLGFILAAAGSAIGLGNIWRFPYITGQNGGGAFVLIYLIFVFAIGLPVMLSECAVGRSTGRNPVGAFKALAPGSAWSIVGFIGIATGVAILSYYTVVAGWTLGYIGFALRGDLLGQSITAGDLFGNFVADGKQQVLYLTGFMVLTVVVVLGGVKGGIERMTKFLMPLLLLLLVTLIIRSLTLDGAARGLEFYLVPRFEDVTGKTIIFAMGQAFFSLSLGMGAMITYGSYLPKKENLAQCGLSVVIFDTVIALMAGLMIFPALGGAPEKGGPGLVFIALVDIFRTMPAGGLVAVIFFLLLAIAALTSTVSLLEVAVSYLIDEKGMKRRSAVILVAVVCIALGIPAALSLGAVPGLSSIVKGMGFLDIMDFTFGNMSLTVGAFLLCIFVGYKWGIKNASAEISLHCSVFPKLQKYWAFSVRVLAPLAIGLLIAYVVITGKTVG